MSIIGRCQNSGMSASAWLVSEQFNELRNSFSYFTAFNLHFKLHIQIKKTLFFSFMLHEIQTVYSANSISMNFFNGQKQNWVTNFIKWIQQECIDSGSIFDMCCTIICSVKAIFFPEVTVMVPYEDIQESLRHC